VQVALFCFDPLTPADALSYGLVLMRRDVILLGLGIVLISRAQIRPGG